MKGAFDVRGKARRFGLDLSSVVKDVDGCRGNPSSSRSFFFSTAGTFPPPTGRMSRTRERAAAAVFLALPSPMFLPDDVAGGRCTALSVACCVQYRRCAVTAHWEGGGGY
ncbi:unnamed protein product [Arctogadus glacialis]